MKIRKKLLLIGILSIFVIEFIEIVGFTVYLRQKLIESHLQENTRNKVVTVGTVGDLIQKEILSLNRKLLLASQIPAVQSSDKQTCEAKLKEIQPLFPDVSVLGKTNTEGRFICSTNSQLDGTIGKNFMAGYDALFHTPQHPVTLNRLTKSSVTQKYLVAEHVPVFGQNKQFLGSFGASIYINTIRDKYFENLKGLNSAYIVVIDDNGDILYHPQESIIGKNLFSPEIQRLFGRRNINEAFQLAKQEKTGSIRYEFQGTDKIVEPIPASSSCRGGTGYFF